MRVELLPLGALSTADRARWRELAAGAVERNPFFEPEFAVPAARQLTTRAPALLVVHDTHGWAACMPVRRALRFRKLPGPALLNWVHTHCFLGTPLMAPGRIVPAWRALLAHVGGERTTGFLGLDLLGDDGDVARGLSDALEQEGMRALLYERSQRAALQRREDGDYLNPVLAGRHRKEIRRQARRLEELLGAPLRTRDRSDEPAAVEAFLALEAAGWKGRAGTALASAGHRGFFDEMARGFAAAGRLQLLALEAGDRTLAMKCNLLAGDAVYCFKIAYDEALSRFSPGIQLELANIDIFHATPGAAWTDSCAAPDNQMINRLWRGRRSVATVLVPGRGPVGSLSGVTLRAALQARRRLGRSR